MIIYLIERFNYSMNLWIILNYFCLDYGTAHVLNIYIQRGSSSVTANADLQ